MFKQKAVIKFFACSMLVFLSFSCSKEEGTGGSSRLIGKLFASEYDNGVLVGEFYAPDERVYIVYGDNEVYDDSYRTHFDGTYVFDDLVKGEYIVYAYSDCATCPSGVSPVLDTIKIDENNSTIELEDLNIDKFK